MQGDPGPSNFLERKRKRIGGSSSGVKTSTQEKKARKSKSPLETGETGESDTQWPDYFKEVSVREDNPGLILRSPLLSVVQGAFQVGARIVFQSPLSWASSYSRSVYTSVS